jgi:hypothetical protein
MTNASVPVANMPAASTMSARQRTAVDIRVSTPAGATTAAHAAGNPDCGPGALRRARLPREHHQRHRGTGRLRAQNGHSAHFPAKEEPLFDAEPFTLDSLSKRLAARAPHESALAALRDWMATTMTAAETNGSELDSRLLERRALRAHPINTEPELRGRARASYYRFERVLAEAIGTDLGQSG